MNPIICLAGPTASGTTGTSRQATTSAPFARIVRSKSASSPSAPKRVLNFSLILVFISILCDF